MATIASLVTNPIFLRNLHPKFSGAKLVGDPPASSVWFSSSVPPCIPKFNIKLKSCCFSAAEYPKELGIRHASLCMPPNAIKDHLGIGQPLGRVGGKWSTSRLYPDNPNSGKPSRSDDNSLEGLVLSLIGLYLFMAWMVCNAKWAMWFKTLVLTISAALMVLFSRFCGETSVIKLQLGFSDKGRDLGFELNQIAETADTSTYKGLSYVLNETIVAFLRHLEYCTLSSISVVSTITIDREKANSDIIDKLSIAERVKNRETLINVNNMKFQRPTSQKSDNDHYNDDVMVTLFVGINGKLELTINNKYDLENVLEILRFIGSSNYFRAVEVLWTPQICSVSAVTST